MRDLPRSKVNKNKKQAFHDLEHAQINYIVTELLFINKILNCMKIHNLIIVIHIKMVGKYTILVLLDINIVPQADVWSL